MVWTEWLVQSTGNGRSGTSNKVEGKNCGVMEVVKMQH